MSVCLTDLSQNCLQRLTSSQASKDLRTTNESFLKILPMCEDLGGGGGGGGWGRMLLPIYDIVRVCVPYSPLLNRRQVYDKRPLIKRKYKNCLFF